MRLFRRNQPSVQDERFAQHLPWPPDSEDGFVTLSRLDRVPPHCDAMVLHAPGRCGYCDHFLAGAAQALRQIWGVAFTGQTPQPGQVPCPSDARRGTAGAHVWSGNKPHDLGGEPMP